MSPCRKGSAALSHDVYHKMIAPQGSATRRVTISKVLLLAAALAAAALATQRPADILFLVTAAFSIAAAAFFPALVLGIGSDCAQGGGREPVDLLVAFLFMLHVAVPFSATSRKRTRAPNERQYTL